MKSPHEIEADRLIEWYEDQEWTGKYCTESGEEDFLNFISSQQAIKCSLNDVENTIKVLWDIIENNADAFQDVMDKYDFQTKVRDILKNRLK